MGFVGIGATVLLTEAVLSALMMIFSECFDLSFSRLSAYGLCCGVLFDSQHSDTEENDTGPQSLRHWQ